MGLSDWLRSAGAEDEGATERDGFLSHRGESHALARGLVDGFIRMRRREPGREGERLYYSVGFVTGYLLKVVAVVALARSGFGYLA